MESKSKNIFEVDKRYKVRFSRDLGEIEEVIPCIIVAIELPLIRVESIFGNFVFNTSSQNFISAELDEQRL